jgi:enoyl-[acyl-carrier protein] reductase I
MQNGGSLLTLTYSGARHVMPSYNVMGVAKAALEASVRYLAADLGPQGVRVNAISAGPMRTSLVRHWMRAPVSLSATSRPMRRSPTLDEVGGAALYLLSDLSGAVTGEVHFVDCGYSTIAMPSLDTLKPSEKREKEVEPRAEKPPREAAQ